MSYSRGTLRALVDKHSYTKNTNFYKRYINLVIIVKYTYLDDIDTFKVFLDLLKRAELRRQITRSVLITNLNILFKEKMHLMEILRLSLKDATNLENGYHESQFMQRYINLVSVVKCVYWNDIATFQIFLDLLKRAELRRQITRVALITNLNILFRGEMHLMEILRLSLKDAKNLENGYHYICWSTAKIESQFKGYGDVPNFRSLINMYMEGRLTFLDVYEEMAIRFHDRIDLLDEFITHFFPTTSGLDKGFSFICEVKNTIQDIENYRQLLLFLHIFNIEVISVEQLRLLTDDILKNCPNLKDDFVLFLARCKKKVGFLSCVLKIACSTLELWPTQRHSRILMKGNDRMKLMAVEDGCRRVSLFLESVDEDCFKDETLFADIKAMKYWSNFSELEFKFSDQQIHRDLWHLLKAVYWIDGNFERTWKYFFQPFMGYSSNPFVEEDRHRYKIFYGDDDFYLLFRLYQMLYGKLLFVKNSCSMEKGSELGYNRFVYALVHSSEEAQEDFPYSGTQYEDYLRALVGSQSYLLFTYNAQLIKFARKCKAVFENGNNDLIELYNRNLCGITSEDQYSIDARDHIYTSGGRFYKKNIYRIESSFQQLSIQLFQEEEELDSNLEERFYMSA